jgi:hypothetical protein
MVTSDWIFGSLSGSRYEVSPPHPERTVLLETIIEKGFFVRTLALGVSAFFCSIRKESISSSLRIILSVYRKPVTNSSSITGLIIAVRAWRPLTKTERGTSITTSCDEGTIAPLSLFMQGTFLYMLTPYACTIRAISSTVSISKSISSKVLYK